VTTAAIDPRLRVAVDASIGWYEDIFALHGIGTRIEDGLWSAIGSPPPFHSDVVALEPTVSRAALDAALAGRPTWGFKDSFAVTEPSAPGTRLLFTATWIHHPGADGRTAPTAWRRIDDADDLAAWNAGWDTADVLLPSVLDRGHLAVLARTGEVGIQAGIEAGAVARLGSGAVDLSNVHGVGGRDVDWEELVAAVGARFPGRPLVGSESGADLAAALSAGFDAVGELRVWART
jgi:hypothetical protein